MLTLSACGDAQVGDNTKNDTTASTSQSSASQVAPGESGAFATIDTTVPKPNFPPPPSGLADDTVPVRTPDGQPARFGVKSGRLTFRYDGDIRGERIVTFDDYGLKERIHDKFAPYPPQGPGPIREIIAISTPTYRIQADVPSRSAILDTNIVLGDYLSSDSSNIVPLSQFIMQRQGVQHLRDTVIAGYHARVMQARSQGGPVTFILWRGITIGERGEFTQMNKHHELVLQNMELNIDLPDSTWEAPSGYTIQKQAPQPRPGGTMPPKK
jgi:hypothetical protein